MKGLCLVWDQIPSKIDDFRRKKSVFGTSNTYVDAKFCVEFIPGGCGAIRNRPDLEKPEKSSKIIQILPFWTRIAIWSLEEPRTPL